MIGLVELAVILLVGMGTSHVHVSGFTGSYWVNDPDKDNQVFTNPVDWTFNDGRRSLTCLSKCTGTPGCMSVFYNSLTESCTGSATLPDNVTVWSLETGSQFFSKITGGLGGPCVTAAECTSPNMACLNGTCQCEVGYSTVPTLGTCVATCPTYGNTFTHYPGQEMIMEEIVYTSGISVDECETLCLASFSSTGAPCAGYTYVHMNVDCFIRYLTPLTGPEYFNSCEVEYASHYLRNCA